MHDKTEQARELRLVRGVTFVFDTLRIRFEPTVVEFLENHRQRNWFANERAGQLFGAIDGNVVTVVEATGPRRGDRANHISYYIDRKAAQREIDERYEKGLHYIGDWHTHPQKTPGTSDDRRPQHGASLSHIIAPTEPRGDADSWDAGPGDLVVLG